MKEVTIYTDGSCPDNAQGSGRGGWCAILVMGKHEKVVSGGVKSTTNNQMELTAVLEGLKALKYPCKVTVYTDSMFVIGTLTMNWRRRNIYCARISRKIDPLLKIHEVTFQHLYGHTGHSYNERCDQIAATEAMKV